MLNAKNKQQYQCPVCGFDELYDPPSDGEICSCCGTQFDSADNDSPFRALRENWIDRYMPWFSRGRKPPKDWNPYRQLISAGFGGDLIDNPRWESDLDFRYSVDEAFADVRMAVQLKHARESHEPPLTQAQIALKAEMKQSRISELESMDYTAWTISTLRRLARVVGKRLNFEFENWESIRQEMEEFTAELVGEPKLEPTIPNISDLK